MPPQKPWLASNGAVMVNIQLECSGLSVSLRNISWSYAIEGMVAVLLWRFKILYLGQSYMPDQL